MDSLKGFEMRAMLCVLVLAIWLVAGCSAPSQIPSADTSAERYQRPTPVPEVTRIDNDIPQSDADEEPIATRSVSPVEAQRADEIVRIVCGIVTDQIGTHEFPRLWGEKSRETQLAQKYERMMGGGFDDRLERECPAYAALHSKNH